MQRTEFPICITDSICFNTASGKSLHATLCPGSRGNTGLKMGFWKTYGLFAVFWKFFLWTLFHFVKKLCFYALPHKALKCPQTFWKSNALFITVSILLFALFCQILLTHCGWRSEQIRRFLPAVKLLSAEQRIRTATKLQWSVRNPPNKCKRLSFAAGHNRCHSCYLIFR